MRPARKFINPESLSLMGVPKHFFNTTLKDYDVTDNPSLEHVKDFVGEFLDNLEHHLSDGDGICFMGSNGVGKSMLSCIILKEAYRRRYSCRRLTFSSYMNAYTAKWGKKSDEREDYEQDLFDKFLGVDLLVLEELGKEIDSKIAKPILEDLLRYREEHGHSTIICTNMTPNDLRELYGSSVCSLINGNTTIITIDGRDRRSE